jgi:hypothetical protein
MGVSVGCENRSDAGIRSSTLLGRLCTRVSFLWNHSHLLRRESAAKKTLLCPLQMMDHGRYDRLPKKTLVCTLQMMDHGKYDILYICICTAGSRARKRQ